MLNENVGPAVDLSFEAGDPSGAVREKEVRGVTCDLDVLRILPRPLRKFKPESTCG